MLLFKNMATDPDRLLLVLLVVIMFLWEKAVASCHIDTFMHLGVCCNNIIINLFYYPYLYFKSEWLLTTIDGCAVC